MQNELLEKLKRKMASAYQKGDIKSLAKYFNVQIDENRIEDYALINANFDIPAAQFWDKKNDVIYVATFNSYVRWYNGNNNGIPYNYVVTINKTHRQESIYSIGADKPFIDRIIFSKDDYDLVVQRKLYGDKDQELMEQYLKNVIYDGKRVQQELLTKIYGKYFDSEGKFAYDFEQLLTYMSGAHRYIDYKDTEDKYFYNIEGNNMIYGINEYERDNCAYLYGLCLEHGNVDINRFLPLNIRYDEFKGLSLNPKSACVFKCGIDGVHHKLGMYVIDGKLRIVHTANRFNEACEGNYEVLDDSEVEIEWPLSEWSTIGAKLAGIFGYDEFTKLISKELGTFCGKIQKRNNNTLSGECYYDYKTKCISYGWLSLNPRALFDKDLEDIAQRIEAKSDEYFSLVDREFCEHANISPEEPVTKQLTPKK